MFCDKILSNCFYIFIFIIMMKKILTDILFNILIAIKNENNLKKKLLGEVEF